MAFLSPLVFIPILIYIADKVNDHYPEMAERDYLWFILLFISILPGMLFLKPSNKKEAIVFLVYLLFWIPASHFYAIFMFMAIVGLNPGV